MNSFSEISIITHRLSTWFFKHRRDLPWRHTNDPYKIWLSEIILQQTRVDQGLPYYLRFIGQFPDVQSLAAASTDEVMKLWQGLGYYSRARNLHEAARQVVQAFGGVFPSTYTELLRLKGVGEYTAAAVSSIAFNEARAVVDGNVQRVLARLFELEDPIQTSSSKKQMAELAEALLDSGKPGDHNQAMMDFGAMQCTPVAPECPTCPLSDLCLGFAHDKVASLPVKLPPAPKQNRFMHYLVLDDGQNTWLQKRTEKDIWQGLYDFPCIESTHEIPVESLLQMPALALIASHRLTLETPVRMKHILSHRHIHAVFIPIRYVPLTTLPSEWIRVPWKDLHQYAVSRMVDRFLEQHERSL